ncbi:MAG: hypothetical protein IRZ05_17565 [Micromonosporaceae bacterium]|nr:hypothetical protein [Micromonosporaceae bacterium]
MAGPSAGGIIYADESVNQGSFAWTSFTPKVYSGGGSTAVSGTVNYAKYLQIGKIVWAMATVTFNAAASSGAAVDLPVPAAFRSLNCGTCALFGSSTPADQSGIAVMTASQDKLVISAYTGGFRDASSGHAIRYSVCYEAA